MSVASGPVLVGPDLAGQTPDGPVTAMVLAAPPPAPDDPGGREDDFGKSSPIGLLVVLLLLVSVAFLIRSMTKHLKRVPASFDTEQSTPDTDTEDGDGDEHGSDAER